MKKNGQDFNFMRIIMLSVLIITAQYIGAQ